MRCISCKERSRGGCGDPATPKGVGVLIRNLARTGQFTGRKPVLTNKVKPVRAAAAGVCAMDMKKIIVLGMCLLLIPDSLCLATRQRPWRMGERSLASLAGNRALLHLPQCCWCARLMRAHRRWRWLLRMADHAPPGGPGICLVCVADQSYYQCLALDRRARRAERGSECWMALWLPLSHDNRPFWFRAVTCRICGHLRRKSVAHVHIRHLSYCGLGAASAAFSEETG